MDDPTHAPSLKPQLVVNTDLLSTYYKPSSVLRASMEVGPGMGGRGRTGGRWGSREDTEDASDKLSAIGKP